MTLNTPDKCTSHASCAQLCHNASPAALSKYWEADGAVSLAVQSASLAHDGKATTPRNSRSQNHCQMQHMLLTSRCLLRRCLGLGRSKRPVTQQSAGGHPDANNNNNNTKTTTTMTTESVCGCIHGAQPAPSSPPKTIGVLKAPWAGTFSRAYTHSMHGSL